MNERFSGKKLKGFNTAPGIDSYPTNLFDKFDELKESIDFKESEKKQEPIYPFYCPECGKGYLSKISPCKQCGSDIDYSRYNTEENEEPFFFPGTNEAFAQNTANNLIKLYYLSIPETEYISIANELMSLRTNLNLLGNPLGISHVLEDVLLKLDVSPDNLSLTDKLSDEFSAKILSLSKELIKTFHSYLYADSSKKISYKIIDKYLISQIAEKKIFE